MRSAWRARFHGDGVARPAASPTSRYSRSDFGASTTRRCPTWVPLARFPWASFAVCWRVPAFAGDWTRVHVCLHFRFPKRDSWGSWRKVSCHPEYIAVNHVHVVDVATRVKIVIITVTSAWCKLRYYFLLFVYFIYAIVIIVKSGTSDVPTEFWQ